MPLVIALTVAAAGCGGAAGGPRDEAADRKEAAERREAPALKLVRTAPLELRGTGFRARDRIDIVLSIGELRRVRRVTASADGSFRIRFDPFLALDVCRGNLAVTATGSGGEKAVYRRRCRPPDPALPSDAPA